MATDVARLSFDPARLYRGVVPQQGRVSLEAEQNEQRVIDAEERRKELLDIVGPAGTPDDGYAVSSTGGPNLMIGAGTMYVGGWRLELDADLDERTQPDWLDRPGLDRRADREHVVLWVQDSDVTAVEDPVLYEVALGGPDGSARIRLLQRVLRLPADASTCDVALLEDEKLWQQAGLDLDPDSLELRSKSRLQVTWEGDPEPADPCEPSSTGGYLGAENQCIRVQIVRANRDGTVDFLWGYDDASFLYRVTPDASANPVLTLDRSPVDDYHRPRAGQAVQALRSAAQLQSTDGVVEGYVASLGGEVGILTAPYDPDTKTVQFPAPLPGAYTDPTATPQLYLRVWEELVAGVPVGRPVSLTGTGLQVTITAQDGGAVHENDFWCIGVRPATPTTVYPDRYLREPQPPDGPHQWVCPLAVIEWQKEELVLLEDCRRHLRPLVDVDTSGCCTLEVRASDAPRLQQLIDAAVAGRVASERGDRVTVCFAPGRYQLDEPIVLLRKHSNVTLRGCAGGAVLEVAQGQEDQFGQGMVLLEDADNVTITGFEFAMPQVPAALAHAQSTTGGMFNRDMVRAINAQVANRYVSIAVRPVNCAVLEIDDCLFRFSLGAHQPTAADAQTMPRTVFGAGILASGGAWGLRLTRNRFLHDPAVPRPAEGTLHLLAGYVLTPAAVSRAVAKNRAFGAGQLHALLDDALIVDNEFHGITVAVLVAAQLAGVRVRDNVVKDCYAGIWIVDVMAAANTDLIGKYQVVSAAGSAAEQIHATLYAGLFDPILLQVLVTAMLYPLPRVGDVVRGVAEPAADQIVQLRERATAAQQAYMSGLLDQVAADQPTAAKATRSTKKVEFTSPLAAAQTAPNKNLLTIWRGLAELARTGDQLPGVTTSLRIERNSVDCAVPDGQASGPALVTYLAVEKDGLAALAVDGNRLVSRAAPLTAAVLGGTFATVNGNTVVGGLRQLTLAVLLVRAVAITGNVVTGGQAALPVNRPFPAPLDSWLPLNTIR